MGVVWRATDSTLGREAAIKILPDQFALDAERLTRFEREAKLLASLSHPNIAGVFGLHAADGVRFLAMEMVKGEDLAERIKRGPLPVDEALATARQIAEALETAHENGVIHRDLKPANVRVTADGTVKVLDFGLAKALESGPSTASIAPGLSPTVTSVGSIAGVILGTAAYMSPEQARGRPVDRRTDIWAFGCVLYEMLTGVRPFDGETVSDSIAKILQTEADLSKLPAGTPRAARELIARCLEKDPKRRLRDIGDARIALEDALRAGPDKAPAAVAPAAAAPPKRAVLPWIVAAVAVVAAIALLVLPRSGADRPSAPRASFFSLNAPPGVRFEDLAADIAVAPDGSAVVVAAPSPDGTPRLYLRRLDDPAWKVLAGTESASMPFWSPNSRSIGFFAGPKLRRISVAGGAPEAICDAAAGRGGAWGADDVIVFAPGSSGPLMQVKASGGQVTPATELDASRGEAGHRFPRFLPDGKRFMYATIPARDGAHESYLATLGSKDRTLVIGSDGVPSFAPPDHLVYNRNLTLFEQSFDPATGKLSGEPRAIVSAGEARGLLAHPSSSVAGTGVLAFVPLTDENKTLTWFGLDGAEQETLPMTPGNYEEVRFSPDGTRAAVAKYLPQESPTAGCDVWIVDLARKTESRFTSNPGFEFGATWSPDGRSITFASNVSGTYQLMRLPSEGAGAPVAITKPHGLTQTPLDIAPDGKTMTFEMQEPNTGYDIWIADPTGAAPPVPYLVTSANERAAMISPDGKWASYVSDESGKEEVYVQSYPRPGSKLQVSNGGGGVPVWSRDGKRLFFVTSDRSLMAAVVTPGDARRVAPPVKLFRFPRQVFGYDVPRDGKRILAAIAANDEAGRSIGLVLNWGELGR